ncbi:Hypothetical predicted protein [Cloeon dipterum]|uniref:Uncharacterized protein n=1 Tax=Cloeon dipterum TaxID=197152 RepID=A0A8S1DTN1_9INSE|nr:Hypothetical predicted protein [Cloeon dipterum]
MRLERAAPLEAASSASNLTSNLAVRMCNKGEEAISVSVIHKSQAHILPTPNSPSYMGQASTVSSLGSSSLQPVTILQVCNRKHTQVHPVAV